MAITPEQIQQLADPIEEVYIHIVDELMVNIGRHITAPTWTHTAAWEVQKLSEMGQLSQESAKIINKWIKSMPQQIRETMEDTRAAALNKLEKQMEKAAKDGHVTPPVADSTVSVLRDYADQAADRLNLVNTTMLQSTLDQYARAVMLTEAEVQRAERTQKVLNEAAGNVATGVETRRVAMRRAIGRIADEGLTGFIDRAGHHWTPEAYVNMDVRTTVHNVAIQSTKAFMQDYNTQVFQVSSHAAARPLCYPYQGKFYSWDNSSGEIELGNGTKVQYEPLNATSYGQAAGLFGINCGHYPIPIIPGMTIPHGADNIQDKEANDKAYKESQEQRAIERKIRAAKRVVEMAGDTATEKDKQKVKDAQAEMREFIERTGRTRRYDREQIGGTPPRKEPGPDERLKWGTPPPTAPTAPTAPTTPKATDPSISPQTLQEIIRYTDGDIAPIAKYSQYLQNGQLSRYGSNNIKNYNITDVEMSATKEIINVINGADVRSDYPLYRIEHSSTYNPNVKAGDVLELGVRSTTRIPEFFDKVTSGKVKGLGSYEGVNDASNTIYYTFASHKSLDISGVSVWPDQLEELIYGKYRVTKSERTVLGYKDQYVEKRIPLRERLDKEKVKYETYEKDGVERVKYRYMLEDVDITKKEFDERQVLGVEWEKNAPVYGPLIVEVEYEGE